MRRRDEEMSDEPYVVIEKRDAGIGSFLIGMAIGAGVALLFAPRTGEETRRDLKQRARRVSEVARDAAGDLSDSVVDQYDQARRVVEDRLDSARQSIHVRRHQAREAFRAGRDAAQQARQDLEDRIAESKPSPRTADGARPGRKASESDAAPLPVQDEGDTE
ncbi:MAG: YtxH domain-containing protein [Gemmatimonadaceae bacterium]